MNLQQLAAEATKHNATLFNATGAGICAAQDWAYDHLPLLAALAEECEAWRAKGFCAIGERGEVDAAMARVDALLTGETQ